MSIAAGIASAERRIEPPRWPTRIYRAVGILLVACFLFLFARFYDPNTGFTQLLTIGDKTEAVALSKLRAVPHHTYHDSYGYDGAYYVQIALSPLLNDPELRTAIDNLPYRARRILLSWTAWTVGGGNPARIVHVFPLLNAIAWLAIAWLTLRWFPLNNFDSLLRWALLLFSHGMCASVRHSLVDAPSLLFIILALRCLERGRPVSGAFALSLAALTRETSVLAGAVFVDANSARPTGFRKLLILGAIVAVPLAAWLVYLRIKLGGSASTGLNNFAVPLSGLVEKWTESVSALFGDRVWWSDWATAACTVALTVQCGFFLARWRVRQPWWRLGASFAILAFFLSRPVWEGTPGAATRVLLPMSLAFNVLVPTGRRWLPILLAGNLSVLASVIEFNPPARFFVIGGDREISRQVTIQAEGNWYHVEQRGPNRWRWAFGDADLVFRNYSDRPVRVTVEGAVSALDQGRTVSLAAHNERLWSAALSGQPARFQADIVLQPGSTRLRFGSDQPAPAPDADGRSLAFSVSNLKLSLRSSEAEAHP